jgi:fatty acid desaturase
MALCAGVAISLWPDPWSLAAFLAYGVLYGSATDSRWHECGHGTAFKTRWMNDAVYQLASFMIMRNPVTWRWSHARHHTDTIIVGRDPEIVAMRPPDLARIVLNLFGILDAAKAMRAMVMNACGVFDEGERTFVPETEQPKIVLIARVWFAVYAATVATAISMGSILPLMLVGLPRLYGAWHHILCGVLQHAGLAEDVLDHRLNSRTVYMNPVSRFIYWNMNDHVEHHMFPMVPYHALSRLHELIKHDLPRRPTTASSPATASSGRC